jgi:hypothetical protein
MAASPPQAADQRKIEDKMPSYYLKLEANYSPELIQMVKWCLELDPLARPQSLFSLQKELALPRVPKKPKAGSADKASGGWRGLIDRMGIGRKASED